MKTNVGGIDRTARLLVGALLVLVALAEFADMVGLGTTLGVVLLVVGSVLLFTGATRKCVINQVLGIDTSRP